LQRATALLWATLLLLTFLLLALLLLRFLLGDLLPLALRCRSLRMRHANEGEGRHDRKTLRSKCNFNHETQPDRGGKHHCSHF
jgi:hypothetical protein